ncbi:MAG: hypothetical protein WCA35_13170 [Kovacikia sp.]
MNFTIILSPVVQGMRASLGSVVISGWEDEFHPQRHRQVNRTPLFLAEGNPDRPLTCNLRTPANLRKRIIEKS